MSIKGIYSKTRQIQIFKTISLLKEKIEKEREEKYSAFPILRDFLKFNSLTFLSNIFLELVLIYLSKGRKKERKQLSAAKKFFQQSLLVSFALRVKLGFQICGLQSFGFQRFFLTLNFSKITPAKTSSIIF